MNNTNYIFTDKLANALGQFLGYSANLSNKSQTDFSTLSSRQSFYGLRQLSVRAVLFCSKTFQSLVSGVSGTFNALYTSLPLESSSASVMVPGDWYVSAGVLLMNFFPLLWRQSSSFTTDSLQDFHIENFIYPFYCHRSDIAPHFECKPFSCRNRSTTAITECDTLNIRIKKFGFCSYIIYFVNSVFC